jgi:hypothetical protein
MVQRVEEETQRWTASAKEWWPITSHVLSKGRQDACEKLVLAFLVETVALFRSRTTALSQITFLIFYRAVLTLFDPHTAASRVVHRVFCGRVRRLAGCRQANLAKRDVTIAR